MGVWRAVWAFSFIGDNLEAALIFIWGEERVVWAILIFLGWVGGREGLSWVGMCQAG